MPKEPEYFIKKWVECSCKIAKRTREEVLRAAKFNIIFSCSVCNSTGYVPVFVKETPTNKE